MLTFLRSRLNPNSGTDPGDALPNSPPAPPQQLLQIAAAELRERSQFHLFGEQQLAVDLVFHAAEHARGHVASRILVVTGGHGNGKSAIALFLLDELAWSGGPVLHATGSRSLNQTLQKVAGARTPRAQMPN
ncbi:hypothetical protein [Rhodococcus erythropolis]|uniref:hypothetical protein n=1 Tax=Rhodococcus erythropolis TaxID=1833 RepID=UPI0022B4418A|nr:hypothetical protein [Rhodococcus erythropolis]